MISAVFVSYRSAALAERAIASFREDARRSGLEAEAIAVVNSGDPAERDALAPVADAVLLPAENLGFAGGLNAGVAAARGETLFLSNPDLVFAPGSVGALAREVEGAGLVAAGPALWADGARTVLLPPSEEARPEELARRALSVDAVRGARVFRRDARRAVVQLERAGAGATSGVRGLSGALVAVSRRTLGAVGGFDERYRLYYEENDWQRRLLDLGGRLLFAGASHVVHYFGQSTRTEPRSAAWFAESEARYFGSHFGEAGRRGLARLAGLAPWNGAAAPEAGELAWDDPRPAAVAISPFPWFRPFGLALVPEGERSYRLPGDLSRARSGEPLFLRAFARDTGAVLGEARVTGG